MRKRLLFVFNPRSGKGQIKNNLLDIIDTFVKGGYEVMVHPTQGPKDGSDGKKSCSSAGIHTCRQYQ